MSKSRIQNAFTRTTILTIGRLLLFILAGFAIGLVVGVASEEPELLAGHVRGGTTTVELDAGLAARGEAEAVVEAAREEGGELPDVAAPPAGYGAGEWDDDDRDARHGAETASASGALASRSPVSGIAADGAAPAAGSRSTGAWAIQVGAFGDEPSARTLATRLEGKGYPIEVLPAGAESSRWRVRVQPIGEEQVARGTAERIEREERLPTWVIRLEGQPRG